MYILKNISPMYPGGPFENKPSLISNKPLSEPMMIQFSDLSL